MSGRRHPQPARRSARSQELRGCCNPDEGRFHVRKEGWNADFRGNVDVRRLSADDFRGGRLPSGERLALASALFTDRTQAPTERIVEAWLALGAPGQLAQPQRIGEEPLHLSDQGDLFRMATSQGRVARLGVGQQVELACKSADCHHVGTGDVSDPAPRRGQGLGQEALDRGEAHHEIVEKALFRVARPQEDLSSGAEQDADEHHQGPPERRVDLGSRGVEMGEHHQEQGHRAQEACVGSAGRMDKNMPTATATPIAANMNQGSLANAMTISTPTAPPATVPTRRWMPLMREDPASSGLSKKIVMMIQWP